MSKPLLEVADIFRLQGEQWRQSHAGHISLNQLNNDSLQARFIRLNRANKIQSQLQVSIKPVNPHSHFY